MTRRKRKLKFKKEHEIGYIQKTLHELRLDNGPINRQKQTKKGETTDELL
jgi:hypothetical protein